MQVQNEVKIQNGIKIKKDKKKRLKEVEAICDHLQPKKKKRKKEEKKEENSKKENKHIEQTSEQEQVFEAEEFVVAQKLEELLTKVEGRHPFDVKYMREFLSVANQNQQQKVVDRLSELGSRAILCLDDIIRHCQGLQSRHKDHLGRWTVASMLRIKEIKSGLLDKHPDLNSSLLKNDVVAIGIKAIKQADNTIKQIINQQDLGRKEDAQDLETCLSERAFNNIKTESLMGTNEKSIQMQLYCLKQGFDIFSDLEKKLLIQNGGQ
eukprot:TRINITY_DN48208_c0_g1_i2.p2 TRINITY_DN48208_c0_g1~~TRINITY_DN48208_c0_g1_i2.p2  ORF type:complete len:305 (-),score=31.62 TRINITY_DN48208_c0_g1_i2:289-1083(-)